MRARSGFLAVLFAFSAVTSFAQVTLPFGEGAGKAGFVNGNNFPGIEEPVPLGPKAFRLAEDHVWVADSIGGKLMKLNKEKGLVAEFSVLASPSLPLPAGTVVATNSPNLEVLLEDLAPVYDAAGRLTAWWIVDLMNNRLLNYSVDGKKLGEIRHEKFVQPYRVEVGAGGHIFVADKGTQNVFIFDRDLKLVSEPHWEWSGFAVDPDDRLYRLFFESENGKTYLVVQNVEGIIEKEIEVDLPGHLNPELWWVDVAKEEFVLTYTPETGYEGKFIVARVGFDGKVKGSGDLVPPIAMNRFIDHQGFAEVWLGAADYGKAPEGSLSIAPVTLP